MKLKISEATPIQIDYLVALCEGHGGSARFLSIFLHQNRTGQGYCYTRDWALAGPLIEQMSPLLEGPSKDGASSEWWCSVMSAQEGMNHPVGHRGLTALIAAMRCYVASRMGNEVEIPEEFVWW